MKYLIIVISMFAILCSAFAQDSTGTKISKAVRKTEEKVGTYAKKTSKGFNHAVQRTDKRYAKAEEKKLDKNTQITPKPRHMGTHHIARHSKMRHHHRIHRRHHRLHHRLHHRKHHAVHHAMKKAMDKDMNGSTTTPGTPKP